MREKSFYDDVAIKNESKASTNTILKLLKPYVSDFIKPIIIASFMLAIAAGMVIGFGKFLSFAVNNGLLSKGSDYFGWILIGLGTSVILLALASYARTYYISWIGEQMMARLRYDLFNHTLKFPLSFFEDYQPANLVTRLTSDMNLLQLVLTNSLGIFIRNFLIIIGGIVMMAVTSWKLFCLTCLIVPGLLLPVIYFGKIVRHYSRFAQQLLADLAQFIDETLNNIKTVLLFSHAAQDRASFHGYNTSFVKAVLKAAKFRAKLVGFAMVLIFSGLCAVAYIGAQMVFEEIMTKGDLLGFLFYAVAVCGALGSFSTLFADFYRAAGASDRILEILNLPVLSELISKKPIRNNHGILAMHQVSFSYPSRKENNVLNHLNLSVLPGETVAIVGPSGAGKSTIFSLLLKFYEPNEGNIYLNGISYQDLSADDIRHQLGLVTQDAVIFSTTIFENLAYGIETVHESHLWQVLEMVHLKKFVEELPYSLQTKVGHRGVRLSGGQKQRLALARVLLRRPNILLLDEATNSLDAKSDFIVQQNLKMLSKQCTTLVIAHRLSTVMEANKIMVLNHGRIEQIGTHQELMRIDGLYKNYANLEFGLTESFLQKENAS
ncbi:MAG: ABC transporter ATP-binding protein [Pseudomonadota bacterium]|jgi:ATP-binding cassette subfamily B protein|nr:ATP-binding cassette domain-containing protein [Alphaproteobacteria bacterium]